MELICLKPYVDNLSKAKVVEVVSDKILTLWPHITSLF
jgi:hypothetical protein